MNLSTLHYVVKINERQNITKAASDLYISQSALSQNLQAAEKELGTLLFDRTRSPLQPTDAGKIFIDWAKRNASPHLRYHKNTKPDIADWFITSKKHSYFP